MTLNTQDPEVIAVPPDVARLVVAARRALEASDWASRERRERFRALDLAAEAFASRVPWEDEEPHEGETLEQREIRWLFNPPGYSFDGPDLS